MENTPEQQKKKFKTTMIVSLIVVIGLIMTVMILSKEKVAEQDQKCCETICGQLNQQCRGWNMDTLECTYNYERFGYPWITEIFRFIIDPETKANICTTGILPPQLIQQQPAINQTP